MIWRLIDDLRAVSIAAVNSARLAHTAKTTSAAIVASGKDLDILRSVCLDDAIPSACPSFLSRHRFRLENSTD